MAIEIGPALGLTADSKSLVAATSDLKDIAKAAKDAETAADSLVGAEKRAGDEAKKMGDKAGKAADETDRLGEASETTDGALRGMAMRAAGLAGALAALAASALSIGAYVELADAWSDMRSQIGAATGDMAGASGMMQMLVDIANASYSPLDRTVQVYAQNVAALRDLGKNANDAANYTESLNHMLVITATKGERAASVQEALSKAMAVGKLQADGLETVLANGGRVAEALAKQLGTTVSGLRALASEGKITGKVIADAIINPLEDVRETAGNMPATVGDAFVRIGTNLTALVGNFDQATGASAALAQSIISLADWIGVLAGADFAAWGDSAMNALTLLGQGVLLLAATRIPSLIVGLRGLVTAQSLMTGQFIAGAVASRGITMALGIQAAAVRGLSAAFTLLGGAPGLLALAITGVGLAMYNNRNEAKPLAESLDAVATAQRDLNKAMTEYSQTGSSSALEAARKSAEEAVVKLNEALAAAEAELERNRANVGLSGAGDQGFGVLFDEARQAQIAAALEKVTAIKTQIADALLVQDQMNLAWEKQAEILGVTAEELTQDQIKARDAAMELLTASQRRVEILAIEKQHGKDSVGYSMAMLAAERDVYFAKVATMQVSEALKNQLRQAWVEEQTALGKTHAWDSAMGVLKRTTAEVLANARSIAATEPSGSWLDGAIAQAKNLAAGLWDAASGLRALGSAKVPGMDTGNADWSKSNLGFTLRGDELLGLPKPTAGSGGLDGGGGGGGNDRQSGLDSLINELRTEQETLDVWRAENLAKIAEYNDAELAAIGGRNEAKLRLETEYQERLKGILAAEQNYRLTETASMFDGLAAVAAAGGKKALRAQAVLSAASALISGYEAAMKAAAEAKTIPGRIAAYAQFVGMGLKAAATIRSAGGAGGGGGGGGSSATAPATSAAPARPQDVILDYSATADPAMRALAAALLGPMIDQLQKASKTGINIVAVRA